MSASGRGALLSDLVPEFLGLTAAARARPDGEVHVLRPHPRRAGGQGVRRPRVHWGVPREVCRDRPQKAPHPSPVVQKQAMMEWHRTRCSIIGLVFHNR